LKVYENNFRIVPDEYYLFIGNR